MDNQKQNTPSSDEMDLGNLFARLGAFFSNLGHSILVLIANLRRATVERWKLLSVVLVVTVPIGIYYGDVVSKKYFQSSMILSSDYLNKRIVESSVQKLNLLLGEANKSGLKKTLQINDSLANSIKEFEARPFIGEEDVIELRILKEQLRSSKLEVENPKVIDDVIKKLEIENQRAFEITIRMYNAENFKNLQSALVSYFRNNEYIKKRIESTKILQGAKQRKMNRDFQRLDSLKAVIYDNFKYMAEQGRQGSNNVILSDKPVSNPIDVYAQDLKLYTEYEKLNAAIILQSDFEVVDGFTEVNVPASQGLLLTIVESILAGFVVFYMLIGLRRFNQRLKELA